MFDQMQRKATLAIVASAGVMLASSAATAAPIEGSLTFGGAANVFTGSDGSGTQVTDFTLGTSVVTDDSATSFLSGTGDFATFSSTGVNSFADFDYQPVDTTSSDGDPPEFPFASFWDVTLGGDTYTMDVSSLTVSNIAPDLVELTGTGTLKSDASAFDDTPGIINGSLDSTGASVGFSSTSAAIPVPSTIALLGAGLIGLGLVARRRTMG